MLNNEITAGIFTFSITLHNSFNRPVRLTLLVQDHIQLTCMRSQKWNKWFQLSYD